MYQDQALPRRPFLGLELRARPAEGASEGLEVVRVAEGGAAALAGVRAGDRLVALGDVTVSEPRALVALVRGLVPGAPLHFEIVRDGARVTLPGKATPLPVERIAGAEVRLGHVTVRDSWRQRTLFAIPTAGGPPFTTVLFLSGLGTASCELPQDPEDPMRAFLSGLADAGIATMRVERSGVGDSEGPPCQTTGFFDEVEGYRAAIESLAQDPLVGRIVIFGHSLGGMIAPILAGEGTQTRGVVVFGTSQLKWVDCMVRATRRQRILAGMEGEELEKYVAAWSEMHASVCREGMFPRDVFAKRPELAWLEGTSCHGETMFGRHVSLFQEIERLDLPALWRTTNVPVLVLHGSYDYAAAPDEGRMIADEIAAASPGRSHFVLLDKVGHDMRRHESYAQSFKNPRAGVWDDGLLRAMLEWLSHEGLGPAA
ncbi:alpha/beta hydrolase family protein [Polyangium jinanense]|uniref:Alpha/beta hydrolase n=1 Tax=Polyangium jinanense TaxID=2829994 RepID=A0A9X3XI43_9BACT|nr:alpha/beta hydrolase [Polyangium jinanense]MDC3962324.1 alpha/beta hydrolase [Polyangium jinanense]MDC3989103.1 alpha/beta hydrolase [Polyangium jinanense]